MVCFESKIVQWSNLAFIYGPCSLGDAISACSELFKWGKSFSSSHPFVRSAPKLISLSPTCHRLPPLLTPKTNPISLPAPPSGSHTNPSRIWFLLSVQFNQAHGIRICIKRKKIDYGKFFYFCAEKCVYNKIPRDQNPPIPGFWENAFFVFLHYTGIGVFWPKIPLNLTSEGLKYPQ